MQRHSSKDFVLHTLLLRPLDGLSLWSILFVWVVRILTLSLLLRTYIAPAVIRLVSSRLRVRSISLRSIRGIYFKAGNGTWRVERIGISYHRPSFRTATRFSVQVQGLSLELDDQPAPYHSRSKTRRHSRPTPSRLARRLWKVVWTLLSSVYSSLEPHCRPAVRSFFVTSIRLGIRALPIVTNGLDFELDSATVSYAGIPGVKFSVGHAKLRSAVSLAYLPTVVSVDNSKAGHKRFASVADWNARLKGSFKRTWDRAWGATQVAASVVLQANAVSGFVDKSSVLFPGTHRGSYFLDVPAVKMSVAARLNPHQGVEPRSGEVSLDLGKVNIQLDVLAKLMKTVKERRTARRTIPEPKAFAESPVPASASSQTSTSAWKSPLSPASPFMGALSASMRWRWAVKQSLDLKHSPVPIVKPRPYVSYVKVVDIKLARCITSYQPAVLSESGPAVLYASLEDVSLNAGLSHPGRSAIHKQWLGKGTGSSPECISDAYSVIVSAKRFTLDRNGIGELMDHMRVATLKSFRWESLVTQWPSPWLCGAAFLAGDPNAQLFASTITLDAVEVTERLDMLEKLARTERTADSVEKAVYGQPHLPSMLKPVPKVALGFHVGDISLRLISPTSENDQEPFVLEARTDGISGSVESHFVSRPDNRFGNVERDFMGLDMEFRYDAVISRSYAKVWFGPDAHLRGSHPQSFHAASYPNETFCQSDAVYIGGTGRGLGEFLDEAGGVVSLDVSSVYTQCQCTTDDISFELWQPDVIKALACILARTTDSSKPRPPRPSRRILDQLPFGVSASMSISRIMLFMTSPDLAPDDTLNISRGLACRTGLSVSYSALRGNHCSQMSSVISRGQRREELSLPMEQILYAVTEPGLSSSVESCRALIQVSLWDVVFRDALSTPFAADDPYGVSDSSVHHRSLEFLHIQEVDVNVVVSGERPNGLPLPNTVDHCQVEVTIPKIKAVMHLSQIYNSLLAIHTLQTLLPSRPKLGATAPRPLPTLQVHMRCQLQHLQLLWGFPLSSKMFVRISSLSCHISPDRKIEVDWNHILAGVNVPVRRDSAEREEWEELVRLPRWHVEILPDTTPLCVKVKGDSGRLRIPFDFVLADLILDINLTIKSVKHLVRMVAAGRYQDPSSPPAEDAKRVHDVHIELGRLVVEAADDAIETKLGLIWRAGFDAARVRQEREEAFRAKVATITSPKPASSSSSTRNTDSDFQFSSKHTVSIMDARSRLDQVHGVAWRAAYHQARLRQKEREEAHLYASVGSLDIPDTDDGDMVHLNRIPAVPPLIRLTFDHLSLSVTPPSFSYDAIPDFLHEAGHGLPRETTFSLLVPMHIHFTVSSLRLAFREYPLPLLHIPADSRGSQAGLDFDSDVVIAEEMGSDHSLEWVSCQIVKADSGMIGASPLSIRIPKTLMPVKSYARPTVRVMTDGITDFSWGVSYSAATQDLMRVLDTLSHAPRDSSPAIGFWDKLRLIMHWRLKVLFRSEVHLHMKGSRDPYDIRGHGAGFALCWKGHPQILVGQPNDANELIQVVSDSMLVIIPNIESSYGEDANPTNTDNRRAQTICAKLRSGVCFGVGLVLERACGPECTRCSGKPFDRSCRLFDFKPHHDVKLEEKDHRPDIKSATDSYNGFRSDFIHMSISLTSGLRKTSHVQPSNLHLSPEVFSHFWSWWHLFNGVLSLPTRQGQLYPRKRPISPKFGQHLATLKYRVSVPQLFISHVYVDNSQDAWADGVTPFVGVKALIEEFHADMHQRDTEATEPTEGGVKTVHHKPFYAIEVVLKGLDLRAMLAIFADQLKQCTPVEYSPMVSNYRTRNNLTPIDARSNWVDMDDFGVDEDDSSEEPEVFLLPTVACPRFTYFKRVDEDRAEEIEQPVSRSKFGAEDTHVCFLGKEQSIPQVQMELASQRVERLRQQKAHDDTKKTHWADTDDQSASDTEAEDSKPRATNDLPRMIALLEGYIAQLRQVDMTSQTSARNRNSSYYMPTDLVMPEEWAGFDNVYQVHCPHIIMDNAIRDIMMQYYYCSRSRRGFEYHMAQRAVKFIRDQAQTALAEIHHDTEKHGRGPAASAQAAAIAVKKLLVGDSHGGGTAPTVEFVPQTVSKLPATVDPLHGWAEGVSARKGHFCLLLKPQIVLRSNEDDESVCVLAAVQGKLKTFSIMDDANAHDPVSGKVMNRNFAWLTGLQTFSPSATNTSGKDYVPLEVLIDLRADNHDFDRLVPQTDATFQYDKFNRLRLRNDVTAVTKTSQHLHAHLQNQTDLVRLHVPRFTVSANDRHFQAISNIVTNLVLFTDVAHKTRAEKLEGLLFSYDFTNLASAADVVANMQQRLRQALETKSDAEQKLRGLGNPGRVELLKIDAHILLLIEELNLIFDAIKLAQDKANNETDQKSALLLHASSEEVSWRMLDQHDQLLAKISIRVTDFYWLSRHDSSTVNNLAVGDLQAFDGAADAEWTEILSKYDEPSTHPLVKRKLFLLAHWTVLPPVGGITIYEEFDLSFHPMRLQIDIRVGRKIMEYLWPARRARQQSPTETESFVIPEHIGSHHDHQKAADLPAVIYTDSPRHASFDLPPRKSLDANRLAPPSPLRRLGTSRSFTDLRNARQDSLQVPRIHRTNSSSSLKAKSTDALAMTKPSISTATRATFDSKDKHRNRQSDDAAEMKTRASQKTFVRVKVASLHLLLSIAKEDSFLLRDARIRTRDLEYRNQTWSFEELVDQFIPSGRNWRGWVKVAFQQPLVPVLPVARELISKTKWITSKKDSSHERPSRPSRPSTPKLLKSNHSRPTIASSETARKSLEAQRKSREMLESQRMPSTISEPPFLTSEPESMHDTTIVPKREGMRKRAISLFRRKHHSGKESVDSSDGTSTTTSIVSHHIMSTTSRGPRTSLIHHAPGPSNTRERNANPRSSLLMHRDTYCVQGQQAELRVPTEGDRGLEGSQVNLALGELDDEYEQDGPVARHHHDDIVEHLDVIDPQISTISTLTNAMNAIVIPPLSFYSRKPVVVLPRLRKKQRRAGDTEKGQECAHEDALDQHVEDVLRKRDKFRRVMQGVWSFVKTPLGFITAIYGFLVVFWGTGIVLFLAKMINLHNEITQGFWVELCQQVETGLFTATSIGFIPFRVMDTYRICKIWRYKRKIAELRAKAGLPELYDPDDLPDPVYDPNYVQVLTEKEQIDLHYQQHQFMKSQTWYRPHGTETHRAFPIGLALWIGVCNDLNSFFQILLSGCMWGLDRFQRPAWTTATTLPAAFVAGIIAGVLIYWGGRKTRRTEQVKDRLRIALEMEHGGGAPKTPFPPTGPPATEEASESPERMLKARTTTGSSTHGGGTRSPVTPASPVEDAVVRRDAEKVPQAVARQVSAKSLSFAEEMVVPPAEEIHH
ncbi:golgi-body localization protein domain-containing protein [Daedaleopsis nitida]|nr:golgi-body localization protein domain-containing protein [Daedaleopsis nitida]